MDSRDKQIETLVRLGMMPVQYLPFVRMGLRGIETDSFLPVNQRHHLYNFIQKFMDIVLNDEMMYRLLRQRVAMTKFEEFNPISEEDMDLKRTPEGMLDQLASSSKSKKKAGGRVAKGENRLASRAKAELRRRRDNKKGREEYKQAQESTNGAYEHAFLTVLASYNVSNITELPQENVKEFFNKVEHLYKSGE
jgi:hypothetical protein